LDCSSNDGSLPALWYADTDGDGYGGTSATELGCSPSIGFVGNDADCDDANASIYPNATEICGNGLDDNCDGAIDEGCCLFTIASFAPTTGPVGTLVTITGTNLDNPTTFTIGGATAIVISKTSTTLVGMVMPGAVTGAVSVATCGSPVIATGNFTVTPAPNPNAQQGSKLVATGNTGAAQSGYSVALSADGNTAIVGGPADNSNQGAAWIYTRSGSTWSQQGTKLVGTGNIGAARQGNSVALSADGNTAIVGGNTDNSSRGAAWVWTRSGSTWTQQGNKLVGTGFIGASQQGWSVAVSADGNTAIVGGNADNSNRGAVWIWVRSGSTWTQQGTKMVGSAFLGASSQGSSVALSADATTAIVGGPGDNSSRGATWVWTRSGSTWTQQGGKLVGTAFIGASSQGSAVAVSADATTAIVGGPGDNSSRGAAWVWTRTGSTWTQQGGKLVGTAFSGTSSQGSAVAVSADGNTAVVGGTGDNSGAGAAWVYSRTGSTWAQQGGKLVGTGSVGSASQGTSVAISANGTTAMVGGFGDNGSAGAAWAYIVAPCGPPTTLSNSNITASSARSNWSVVTGAATYRYRYRVVGAPTWITATTNSAFRVINGLTASTNYEWQVQANCSGSYGDYTSSTFFTTLGITPRLGEQSSAPWAFSIHPNPSNGRFTVTPLAEVEGVATVYLVDIAGRIVVQQTWNAGEDATLILDKQMDNGIYLLTITAADGQTFTSRVVIAN